MNDMMCKIEDEAYCADDVADEAVEAAGLGQTAATFTLGACTGLSVCDG